MRQNFTLCDATKQRSLFPSSEYFECLRHSWVCSGRDIVIGEFEHGLVGVNSRIVERGSLRCSIHFVWQTEAPSVGKPPFQHIGKHALGVLVDAPDMGRAAHQRLG